jgi:SAM-dependent methyltransferase
VSSRLENSWLVRASHQTTEGNRCVDIFERPNGTFGFEEFRRDPEDMGAWTPTSFFSGHEYPSESDAVEAARRVVPWLGQLLDRGSGGTSAGPSEGRHELGRGDPYVPDELAYAGPEHLDESYIAGYDTKQKYDPSADVAALRERGLGARSTLIDMGCGTGTFPLAVAPHCRSVIAVDVSQPMLDHLAAGARKLGVDNIELVRAGFLTYEHHGDPVDFVFTRNALHQLPDFWKAFALTQVASTMSTGALLWLRDLIYAFEPAEVGSVMTGWFGAAADDPAEGYTSADLATHVRTEFSTFTWLLEPLLAHAGFRVLDTDIDRRRTYARYACMKV